ncbi:hypothetical protein SAMN05216412_101594 [Nitrosospira multiformis]|uniref:Uncharacterized protein n=1 Tax=Nitrosospira multiformis TaxID=1231 RepID=A0A1H9ZDC4_9PROT|nr:hypothetical protein SAMN05216412_101594 [Nitrosospira multiformis]
MEGFFQSLRGDKERKDVDYNSQYHHAVWGKTPVRKCLG